jgi:uncharacterized protein (TIGR02145 family)
MKKLLVVLMMLVLISCKENEAPTCKIVLPEQNTTFLNGETISITVSATDPDGIISEVNISLDNIGLTTLTASPFTYSINSDKLESGNHVLSAIAFDDAGAYESDEISIQIASLPEAITLTADSVKHNSAIIKGAFSFSGLEPISSLGFYWGTEQDPVLRGVKIESGQTNSPFSVKLEDLDEIKAYYYVAYARTILGETQGEMNFFKTDTFNVSTLQDIEGNNYNTALIGDQWWMAENLKTTKLNDGTDINQIVNNADWQSSQQVAYAWYSNEQGANTENFGALYNFAALESGTLCPEGWHVPDDQEWKELEMHFHLSASDANSEFWRGWNQGSRLAGEVNLWEVGALSSHEKFGYSRFNALPAGLRQSDGTFHEIGETALWWSATESSESTAMTRKLSYMESGIYRGDEDKNSGFSVRCIKD